MHGLMREGCREAALYSTHLFSLWTQDKRLGAIAAEFGLIV